ncbi:MAG: ferredoxin [Thermodesulfobacteriota bacterium]|jgi:ferredoxin
MSSIPVIETEDCVGCGSCVEICPQVFVLNESLEKAQVINLSGCTEEKIIEAIETCPVSCIHWED